MATNLTKRVSELERTTADDGLCTCSPVSVRLVGTRDGHDGPEVCPKCGKPARVTLVIEYERAPRADDPAQG